MSMAEEMEQVTAEVLTHQQLGLSALTEAPMELGEPAAGALQEVLAARAALIAAARHWDAVAGG